MGGTVNAMDSESDLDEIFIDSAQPILEAYPGLTRGQAFNLYLSHALSTWNARGYEFAAVGIPKRRLASPCHENQ